MRERQNINRTKKDTRGRKVSIEVRKILRMRWTSLGKVENWMEQLSKNSSFVSIKHFLAKWWWRGGVGGFGGEGAMVLLVVVEVLEWSWWWERSEEIAETYFVHLLLRVVWESQGTKSVKFRKTPSPNICLKRTAAKKRRTQKNKTPSDILSTFL